MTLNNGFVQCSECGSEPGTVHLDSCPRTIDAARMRDARRKAMVNRFVSNIVAIADHHVNGPIRIDGVSTWNDGRNAVMTFLVNEEIAGESTGITIEITSTS